MVKEPVNLELRASGDAQKHGCSSTQAKGLAQGGGTTRQQNLRRHQMPRHKVATVTRAAKLARFSPPEAWLQVKEQTVTASRCGMVINE